MGATGIILAAALAAVPVPAGAGDVGAAGLPSAESGPAAIPSVRSGTLVAAPGEWDGRVVSFTGEAIGEAMVRGENAWIHLNDDAYMWKNIEEGAELGGYNSGQAIWLPAALASRITFFGDFAHEGDVVTVAGTFHAACREHGGDMDIHATHLTVVKTGHPVTHVLNRGRLGLAAVLLCLSLVIYAVKRKAEKRRI